MKITDDVKAGKKIICRVRDMFPTYSEFDAYCVMYGLHIKLGFASDPTKCWDDNMKIEANINIESIKA